MYQYISAPPMNEMQELGQIHGLILKQLKNFIRPGITGQDIENKFIEIASKYDVQSACKGKVVDNGVPYPTNLCVSVNNEAIHVFPTAEQKINLGDLVTVDLVLTKNGVYTDAAFSMVVNKNSNKQITKMAAIKDSGLKEIISKRQKLVQVAYNALNAGIKQARGGKRVGDIGHAIYSIVKKAGYDVLYDYGGHGIGYDMWQDPFIPNYGNKGTGPKLKPGMFIAIEPLITTGESKLEFIDEWRTRMADNSDFVQVEATVMVGKKEPIIITPTNKF